MALTYEMKFTLMNLYRWLASRLVELTTFYAVGIGVGNTMAHIDPPIVRAFVPFCQGRNTKFFSGPNAKN